MAICEECGFDCLKMSTCIHSRLIRKNDFGQYNCEDCDYGVPLGILERVPPCVGMEVTQ